MHSDTLPAPLHRASVCATAVACAFVGLACTAAVEDDARTYEQTDGESAALVTTSKGGRISDEGGATACGTNKASVVASYWDSLPFPAGAAIYKRVVIALVSRKSGSVTEWYDDPIRIEVANYSSCETIKLVVAHELGHAFRALYMGASENYDASSTSEATASKRRDEWAGYFGHSSWNAMGGDAKKYCGAGSSHCALATDELFAETFRGLFYKYKGGDSNVWCRGSTPCWIYNFYGHFDDPKKVAGYRNFLLAMPGSGAGAGGSKPKPLKPSGCGVVEGKSAEGLVAGETFSSCNGKYFLAMQSDDNLVLYKKGAGALWSTKTTGTGAYAVIMQKDGNFVVYDAKGKPLWSSKTGGNAGAYLAVQDDGNLVVYTPKGTPLWATGT